MRDSQNLDLSNQLRSFIQDEEPPEEEEIQPKDYYYDDATGYEIYRDEAEDEEEGDPAEKKPE